MNKEWTGERLETFIFNETTIEHLHRYAIASELCKDMDVLDIASGEGYGSNLLSLAAKSVTGVDISKEAVTAAAEKYKRSNLVYLAGSASNIPVADHSADAVVSFETIEHHDQHQEMMQEIKRVLKPGGLLIMSSPDKKYYSDVPGYNNPFHVKELYAEEFKGLIKTHFRYSYFLSQKILTGSLILPDDAVRGCVEYNGDYGRVYRTGDFAPLYNVCIASDSELTNPLTGSLFDGKKINEEMIQRTIAAAVEHAVKTTEERYRSSWSYKIGHSLLAPVKMLRRTLKHE